MVGNHRIIGKVNLQSILERDTASSPASDVIHENVVGHGDVVPGRRVVGEKLHFSPIDGLQPEAATTAALGGVALEQVGVNP